jgi:catechol 2,3-dioxygenase-like lactoylglutathione lyase family enzyme
LTPVDIDETGGRLESLDGTYIEIRAREDARLPAPLETGSMLRQTIYGVADAESLKELAEELSKDRDFQVEEDGSFETVDASGFALRFQLTIRKPIETETQIVNAPGSKQNRPINHVAAHDDYEPKPITLSHVVYFVPNIEEAEAFYERIGFTTADRFIHVGPFMRPAGTNDHHTLFMLNTPPEMKGIEHFTFHLANPSDLMLAGRKFVEKGYETFWGPGRHILGSNWFWYFNSPMGAHVEYDADMDLHDDSWEARVVPPGADNSQIFNLNVIDKWAPGGPPEK